MKNMFKKRFPIILILAIVLCVQAKSQDNAWMTLTKVTFEKNYDEMMGMEVESPVYSKEVLELQGKEISVKGYIVPLKGEVAQSHFMFSAYPYNMCYFCGGAGPETVMQVFMKGKKEVAFSSKPIYLKGNLQLSFGDVNNLMYTLTNAEVIN